MKISNRDGFFWLSLGSFLAAATVGLGAFGAHGLESAIEHTVDDPAKKVRYWETATRYQMYHCLGIILVGFSINRFGSRRILHFAAICFVLGIMLFSGLLYVLAITDLKILGAIIPLGGLSMIVGWIAMAIGFMPFKLPANAEPNDG